MMAFEEELLNSEFQFSVASLYKPGDYYLSVYFPSKKYLVMEQLNIWVILSVIFLIMSVNKLRVRDLYLIPAKEIVRS